MSNPLKSVLQRRSLAEIISSRSAQRANKYHLPTTPLAQSPAQQRLDSIIRKTLFSPEDKIFLLRLLQKKHRLRFTVNFPLNHISIIEQREKKIVERAYDPSKRSYFVIRGRLHVCQKGVNIRETSLTQNGEAYYQQIMSVNEQGIGILLNEKVQLPSRCLLVGDNILLLKIDHSQQQLLQHIEHNCLLTSQEIENAVKQFPLLAQLDNINKYYSPYFKTMSLIKNQYVYEIGNEPEYLYLIVQGEIQFESKISLENPEKDKEDSIWALTLKNLTTKHINIVTETISKGNFFGEQELLQLTQRQQNAKCASITALLMLIPIDKFLKLINHNHVRETIAATIQQRQYSRLQAIQNYSLLQAATRSQFSPNRQGETSPNRQGELSPSRMVDSSPSRMEDESQVDFSVLNKHIYLTKVQFDSPAVRSEKKLSLNQTNVRIVHGNQIKVAREFASTPQPERFNMLDINKSQYNSSIKKFKKFHQQAKNRQSQTQSSVLTTSSKFVQPRPQTRVRSLKQVWQVLNLDKVLQEEGTKLQFANHDGKAYYQAHMKLVYHLGRAKCYRPKTISSSNRAKTQYIQYLQKIL